MWRPGARTLQTRCSLVAEAASSCRGVCVPARNESGGPMKLTLHVWRQKDRNDSGHMERHVAYHVSPDMSFLEMLDVVNEGLIKQGKDPIAFDHDCREGICGSCAMMINGMP